MGMAGATPRPNHPEGPSSFDKVRRLQGRLGMSVIDWLLEVDPAIRWQVMRETPVGRAAERGGGRAVNASPPRAGVRSSSRFRNVTGSGTAAPTDPVGWTSRSPSSTRGPRRISRFSSFASLGLTRRARKPLGRSHSCATPNRWRRTARSISRVRKSRALTASRSRAAPTSARVSSRSSRDCSPTSSPDGGWNCWAPYGATVSSFHSTLCVLEGLLEWERAGGLVDGSPRPRVVVARSTCSKEACSAACRRVGRR